MSAELHVLQDSNYRQIGPTLREIAADIEAGRYGEVGSVAVVLLGSTMEVFGAGPDSEGPSIALMLHAGFLRLSRAIEEHGR